MDSLIVNKKYLESWFTHNKQASFFSTRGSPFILVHLLPHCDVSVVIKFLILYIFRHLSFMESESSNSGSYFATCKFETGNTGNLTVMRILLKPIIRITPQLLTFVLTYSMTHMEEPWTHKVTKQSD